MCIECPARLAADPDGAFPTFLAHHQDLVYGLALRSTGRPSDAEDLAQEAFLRAWRSLRRYGHDRVAELHARGWLAAIVLNLARNRARSMAGRPEAALEAAGDPVDPGVPSPEEVAARRESAAEWRASLAALPPRYRVAVELRHVEALSYPEIAVALGRPVGSVKSDAHRGVRLLREQLGRERLAVWGMKEPMEVVR